MNKKLWQILPIDREAKREMLYSSNVAGNTNKSDKTHLRAAAKWLCRAQDNSASADGGVARAFKCTRYWGEGSYGWQPSYPETTGYILPTFLALSDFFDDDDFYKRAIRMADWEVEIQLPTGAVMGSVIGAPISPAAFNTGQVIFGWLSAFDKTGNKVYLNSAKRAGEYLVSIQDTAGGFGKGDSQFARKGATTYNARVAWALILLGKTCARDEFIVAGKQNIEGALKKQNGKGWFADNCLTDARNPLLHTIGYTIRGILEAGILLNESRYLDAAFKAMDALCRCQQPNGQISGRLDENWKPRVNYDCITGDAQIAIAWMRGDVMTGRMDYKEAARRVIDFIKTTQNLNHPNPGIRGGIKGSFPFDGEYGQYELLNWATKFFCDALMLLNDTNLLKKGIAG